VRGWGYIHRGGANLLGCGRFSEVRDIVFWGGPPKGGTFDKKLARRCQKKKVEGRTFTGLMFADYSEDGKDEHVLRGRKKKTPQSYGMIGSDGPSSLDCLGTGNDTFIYACPNPKKI